jgi:hypothetical protein
VYEARNTPNDELVELDYVKMTGTDGHIICATWPFLCDWEHGDVGSWVMDRYTEELCGIALSVSNSGLCLDGTPGKVMEPLRTSILLRYVKLAIGAS